MGGNRAVDRPSALIAFDKSDYLQAGGWRS